MHKDVNARGGIELAIIKSTNRSVLGAHPIKGRSLINETINRGHGYMLCRNRVKNPKTTQARARASERHKEVSESSYTQNFLKHFIEQTGCLDRCGVKRLKLNHNVLHYCKMSLCRKCGAGSFGWAFFFGCETCNDRPEEK